MATVEALKDKKYIELLKTVLKQRSIRHYLMFVIGCNTGLRIGDILRLRVSDFITGERRSVKKHLVITEQKTDKVRQIAINGTIQKALKQYLSHYNPIADEYLFISRKGVNSPISCTQAYRILNAAAADCKIDINFGTHTMRKTWGYWTYKNTGNNLGLVMDMLNHSSPSITLRYIGITQEQKDNTYLMVEI
jgi:integrase